MTYSTCSLNPIENEAVIGSILRKFKGKIEIVDTSKALPGLQYRGGITKWRVKEKDEWYSKWEDSPQRRNSNKFRTMYPPPSEFHPELERTIRLLPHSQNTGGFFVALIRKLAPIGKAAWPNTETGSEQQPQSGIEKGAGLPAKTFETASSGKDAKAVPTRIDGEKGTWVSRNILIPEKLEKIVSEEIFSFFGISAVDFPIDLLISRGSTVYLV